MTNIVSYNKTSDTNRGPSPSIWGNCPWMEIEAQVAQGGGGYTFWDDFVNHPSMAAGDTGKYGLYFDSGCLANQAAAAGGVVALAQDGTDNDEIWLQAGGGHGSPFVISDTAGSDKKLWFEARIKTSTIVDDVVALFVGLAEEGLTAVETKIDNTGAFADKDHIGFDSVHRNSGTAGTNALVNVAYRLTGATANTLITTAHTLVADTYVKLGFVYDPDAVAAKRIGFYVNGTEQTTYVTATQIATSSGVAFPDGQTMTPTVGCKAGEGTASTVSLDWWRVAQLG